MITEKCTRYLTCPIDNRSLHFEGTTVSCNGGHSFDISKEGYLNLLPRRKKIHETIGDNKEMLLARSNFLGAGHYTPLLKEISRLVKKYLTTLNSEQCVLEVGSGTGHYLHNLYESLKESNPDLCYFGSDISKAAARFSAKQYQDLSFIVADTYEKIPLQDNSVLVLLNVFSPRNKVEFRRLLADNGLLVTVIPTERHLHEIIPHLGLIGYEKNKRTLLESDLRDSFTLSERSTVEYKISLSPESLLYLIMMGPNYWYLDEEKRQKISALVTTETTASFDILVYRAKDLQHKF